VSARIALVSLSLALVACDARPTASGPADVTPQPQAPEEPVAPASFADTLASLDPTDPDAFAQATDAFAETHAAGTDPASTARDVEALTDFVLAIANGVNAKVQADPALLSAACASVGVECGGPPTTAAVAQLAELRSRGVRFDYAGEGTVQAVVDHGVLADDLGDLVSPATRAVLLATDATARAESRYDEGGFNGDPNLMAQALVQWESVVTMNDPLYREDAAAEAARLRTAYLRLCDHGEWETPSCNAREPLQASYASFVAEHPDSTSTPAVAALRKALKAKRWKATSEQLDAMVSAALAASSP